MVTPFLPTRDFTPKLKVSLESVVSDTAHSVASDLKELHQYLHNQIAHALKQYEVHSATRRLLIPRFQVGDTVWLDSQNIKTTQPSKKLGSMLLGTIPIMENVLLPCVSTQSAPGLHLVFHVLLLQPTSPSDILTGWLTPHHHQVDNSVEWRSIGS